MRLLRRMPVIGPPLVRAELLRRHRAGLDRPPQIDPPVTFNDHMLHRLLYDRDPRLKITNNKLAAREMIRREVGEEFLVPLLGVWKDPSEIEWHKLPERFVLKPSHLSGAVALVRTPEDRNPTALAAQARA